MVLVAGNNWINFAKKWRCFDALVTDWQWPIYHSPFICRCQTFPQPSFLGRLIKQVFNKTKLHLSSRTSERWREKHLGMNINDRFGKLLFSTENFSRTSRSLHEATSRRKDPNLTAWRLTGAASACTCHSNSGYCLYLCWPVEWCEQDKTQEPVFGANVLQTNSKKITMGAESSSMAKLLLKVRGKFLDWHLNLDPNQTNGIFFFFIHSFTFGGMTVRPWYQNLNRVHKHQKTIWCGLMKSNLSAISKFYKCQKWFGFRIKVHRCNFMPCSYRADAAMQIQRMFSIPFRGFIQHVHGHLEPHTVDMSQWQPAHWNNVNIEFMPTRLFEWKK